MAVTVDSASEGSAVALGTTGLTFSHTNNSADNLLVVTIGSGASSPVTPTALTYAGTSILANVLWNVSDANFCRNTTCYKNGSLATGANNVVITNGQGSSYQFGGLAQSFAGHNTSSPFGTASTKANTTDNPINVSITGTSGNLVFGSIYTDSSTITETGTLINEIENIASDTAVGSQTYASSASVTVQWSLAGAFGGAVGAVEIFAASTGSVASVVPMYIRRKVFLLQ